MVARRSKVRLRSPAMGGARREGRAAKPCKERLAGCPPPGEIGELLTRLADTPVVGERRVEAGLFGDPGEDGLEIGDRTRPQDDPIAHASPYIRRYADRPGQRPLPPGCPAAG